MKSESAKRKIAFMLRLAADKTATRGERAAARKLSKKLLKRHGWQASDFSGFNPDHPGYSIHTLRLEGLLTTAQKHSSLFLVSIMPRLDLQEGNNGARAKVIFKIPLPAQAQSMAEMWVMQAKFLTGLFRQRNEMADCVLVEDSFYRGVLQAVAQSIGAAKEKLKKSREKALRLKAPIEPRNPLAIIHFRGCSRPAPATTSIERCASNPAPVGHGPEMQSAPEEPHPDSETHEPAPQENLDTYSFSVGFEEGQKVDVSQFVKTL